MIIIGGTLLLLIAASTHRKVVEIEMNQQELQVQLGNLGEQLNKALGEIRTEIENAGNTTPEVDAALQRAQEVAQALDDLNPDNP